MMAGADDVVGVALAAVAAAAFELSYALQALEARSVRPAGAPQLGLLLRLARRPAWIAAMALTVTGFVVQVLALRHVALSVVQPVLALGLVLLLALSARLLGERVGRREVAAAATIIAGVALLVAAMPERGPQGSPAGLAAACVVLGACALAPYAARSVAPPALVGAAVAGDALAALAINQVARTLTPLGPAPVGWAALAAAAGLLALASETTALQRSPASVIAPIVLAGQVVVPVALAPLVAGDRWGDTALGGGLIGLGVVLVALGAFLLGRSPAVGQLRASPT